MRKSIEMIIKGDYAFDGAGVKLMRIFGGANIAKYTDPFLLLDNFGSKDQKDYEKGFPWHPHRGIETVTYIIEGKVKHRDSTGVSGVIGKGELQWMSAGSGIYHEEMPQPSPEGLNGLQLWINLPKEQKMSKPKYRNVKEKNMPTVIDSYNNKIRVISGRVKDAIGPVADTSVPIGYEIIEMPRKSIFESAVEGSYTTIVYVLDGKLNVGSDELIGHGTAVIYKHDGDSIAVSTENESAKLILLTGKRLDEPIAWYGPIVMNYRDELVKAYEELENNTFIKESGDVEDL